MRSRGGQPSYERVEVQIHEVEHEREVAVAREVQGRSSMRTIDGWRHDRRMATSRSVSSAHFLIVLVSSTLRATASPVRASRALNTDPNAPDP